MSKTTRTLWVFYHYFYPDDVVSAVHLGQLCTGLGERGWRVTALPCNRGCRDEGMTLPAREQWEGVAIRRIWRPRFRQASTLGRLLNAAWMICAWGRLALTVNSSETDTGAPDAIVIGTDPILSVVTALVWKALRPKTRLVHWCFDLYPEAAFADGLLDPAGWPARLLTGLLRKAYAACDAVVDIGPCMSARLAAYRTQEARGRRETVVPWALEEPPLPLPPAAAERAEVFGAGGGESALALLYSGSFGRAHTYRGFLDLARALRGQDATLAFSVRGNRVPELRAAVDAVSPEFRCPIRFAGFAPEQRLLARLAAPDVHLLSLEPAWTGLVVPSKFFGALAVGRPVLFSGGAGSSITRWVAEHELGWVLTEDNVRAVADDLLAYVRDPARVAAQQRRCLETYRRYFSRETGVERMNALLHEICQPLA